MKKVIAFTKYTSKGASSRLRTFQYERFFIEKGYKIEYSPLFTDSYLNDFYSGNKISKRYLISLFFNRLKKIFTVFRYDFILIEKELFPYFPAIFECILSFFGFKFVVDYDDAIFHNYDQSRNFLIKFFLKNKIKHVMSFSNKIFVGNKYLFDYASSSTGSPEKIHIIPTVVDLDKYKIRQRSDSRKKINIGWIGTPYTQKYLYFLSDTFSELSKVYDINIVIVGGDVNLKKIITNSEISIVEWSEATEVQSIEDIDIGIMPLPNESWERGKCGYKLIQYMAMGKPVVASPVGVNRSIVCSNNCGLIAETSEEWLSSLEQLILDEDARNLYGLNGRNVVENVYSVQAQAPRIFDIYSRL